MKSRMFKQSLLDFIRSQKNWVYIHA